MCGSPVISINSPDGLGKDTVSFSLFLRRDLDSTCLTAAAEPNPCWSGEDPSLFCRLLVFFQGCGGVILILFSAIPLQSPPIGSGALPNQAGLLAVRRLKDWRIVMETVILQLPGVVKVLPRLSYHI